MGSAMLEGWIKGGVQKQNVYIVDPYAEPEKLGHLSENIHKDKSELQQKNFDLCMFAVKPQNFREVVAGYKDLANENCLFFSVAAGITIETITECLGGGANISRVMPNLPATIGEAVCGIYFAENVNEGHRTSLKALLNCNGAVVETSNEEGIDKVTAISGSGPAYIFHFIEAMEEIAKEYGFDETDAKLLATQTVFGAAKLAKSEKISASELRKNVTSPGGTTQAALEVLMDENSGLKQLLKRAANSAKDRSIELRS